MTLRSIPPVALYADAFAVANAVFNNIRSLGANGDKDAWIIQAPKTGTIDRVCFRTMTVTTGDTVDVRLETVDASGNPSGTLLGTNSNKTQVVANADDNTWFEVTLNTAVAVTQGQDIAVVVAAPAAGAIASGLQIASMRAMASSVITRPYVAAQTGGTWTKQTNAMPVTALRYNDATYPYICGCVPWSAVAAASFDSTATPDERGNKITMPFAATIIGAWSHTAAAGTGDYTIKLYGPTGSLVASRNVDGDQNHQASSPLIWDLFDTAITVQRDDVIRITKVATTATTVSGAEGTVANSNLASAMPNMGSAAMLCTRADSGVWTDTATKQDAIGLIVSAFGDERVEHVHSYAV